MWIDMRERTSRSTTQTGNTSKKSKRLTVSGSFIEHEQSLTRVMTRNSTGLNSLDHVVEQETGSATVVNGKVTVTKVVVVAIEGRSLWRTHCSEERTY